MSDLSNLRRPPGAHRDRKRPGRGPGSGKGKTAGRGHKGQKARTGHHGIPAWFEGGQMPIQRRVPKRGFTNNFRTEYEIVNLDAIAELAETEITPEVLHRYRLVDLGRKRPIKVLANGTLERKVTVHAHRVSAAARAKIEAAGGTVALLES
jgi:large subunit ribosomal protein L15